MDKASKQFRMIAIIEGWSFILLLLIGMPLKYMAGIPLPVKILGWIHGVLFVAFCGLLLNEGTLFVKSCCHKVLIYLTDA
jgi:integral membrane protein